MEALRRRFPRDWHKIRMDLDMKVANMNMNLWASLCEDWIKTVL